MSDDNAEAIALVREAVARVGSHALRRAHDSLVGEQVERQRMTPGLRLKSLHELLDESVKESANV